MDSYESVMVDQDGHHVSARTLACPSCGGIHFLIYYIGNQTKHSHLMCAECEESFCEQGDDCELPNLKKDH